MEKINHLIELAFRVNQHLRDVKKLLPAVNFYHVLKAKRTNNFT